jgi:DnaJ-class molecular chaperone
METRDFYAILGVSRDAAATSLRAAYRHRMLARASLPGGATPLGDLIDAYQVLSDAAQRASYDQARVRPTPPGTTAGPASRAEPLLPERLSLPRDFEARDPSVEQVLERILRNFTGQNVPKSERLEALDLTVAVSPELAERGGVIELAVPVFYPCPDCRGDGHDGLYACLACGQSGMIEDSQIVHLRVLPLTRDGASFHVPLQGLGIANLCLRVHLRIAG